MLPLAECPACRHPQNWKYLLRPLWAQWNCPVCGSRLGINPVRRLLAIFLFLLMIGGLYFSLHAFGLFGANWAPLVPIAALLPWSIVLIALDRPRLLDRAGFYCHDCGYDLRGQTEPRCPECGRELSNEERHIMQTGQIPADGAPLRRRWTVLIAAGIILLVFNIGLLWGILTSLRGRPTPTNVPTTAPASVPATSRLYLPASNTINPFCACIRFSAWSKIAEFSSRDVS